MLNHAAEAYEKNARGERMLFPSIFKMGES